MQHRRLAAGLRRTPCRLTLLGLIAFDSIINEVSVDAFALSSLQTRAASSLLKAKKRTCNNNQFDNAAMRHRMRLSYAALPDNQLDTSDTSFTTKLKPHLHQLFLMMRPINFPIVTIFHILGVHLSVQLWQSSSHSSTSLLSLLKHPSMLMVLLSLLLVTSTSMITNDYYDAKNGVDTSSSEEREAVHYHPLAQGLLPYSLTKTFDSYLYAILLLSSAFVPGVIPRLMVISGAIVTYLYTVHLKPKTFVKNWSCAALVAMSPVTSGLAAWEVLRTGGIESVGSTVPPFLLVLKSPLAYLVAALFAGITSREIMMDITDCESDDKAGILTIPVKYGRGVAANVAFGWSMLSSAAACALPLAKGIPLLADIAFGFGMVKQFTTMPLASLQGLATFIMIPTIRRLCLSVIGSTMLLYRAYSVSRTKGEDVDLADKAVGHSLFSVLLVLSSFV